jgi:NitT/TauT family transport system permease protein
MKDWFKLNGELHGSSKLVVGIVGFALTILLWYILAELFSKKRPIYDGKSEELTELIDSAGKSKVKLWGGDTSDPQAKGYEKVYPLLPRPDKTLISFKPLFTQDHLVSNTMHSMWLNIQGYFWAILFALPIGMILSLFPIFRNLFARQIDAMRYLPLSALTGLFIIWFGLGDSMKIAFLAVGILVYLIPVVMQRMKEVDQTMTQTAYTLGATSWLQIRKVYFPASLSFLIDDIRVLTAISWTYIIIAELLNKETGIGALIYTKARQGQTDRVFAILIIITLIGLLQDQLFKMIDRVINPHKYYKSKLDGLSDSRIGLGAWIAAIIFGIAVSFFPSSMAKIMGSGAWLLAAAGTIFLATGFFKLGKS